MSIQSELRTRLLADGTVSGLVSSRFYATNLPQNPTMPAIVMFKVSGPREHNLSGAIGWARARMQIDCWDEDPLGAQTIADAVRADIDGYTGLLTTLKATIKLDNEQDDYDADARLYRVIQDYRILHEE